MEHLEQTCHVKRDKKKPEHWFTYTVNENWNQWSKLTESQSQDDDTELNSQQEEPGDFPEHLKRQQTS